MSQTPAKAVKRSAALVAALTGLAVPWVNVIVNFHVTRSECGGDGYPFPVSDSPKGAYCAFWKDPDGTETWFTWLLYVPSATVVIALIWSLMARRLRIFTFATLFAYGLLAVYLLPALLLPGADSPL